MTKPNVIVCAANRTRGIVILGVRHCDMQMHAMEVAHSHINWHEAEQGFIDKMGAFHSRTEAWKIAEAAGQIKYRCGGDTKDGGTLYSENLY